MGRGKVLIWQKSKLIAYLHIEVFKVELIKIDHLQIDVAATKLLEIDSLNVTSGQKIGLIGDNGVGKTTLVNILAQQDMTDSFTIKGKITRNCNFAYVPQLLDAKDKSGGQREKLAVKLAIAKLKNMSNGLLLLDEPTSNLDVKQQKWLVQLLQKSKIACLIVSHDQNFLSQVCNNIWYIQKQKASGFTGTYSEFQQFQADKRHFLEKEYEQQKKRVNQLQVSSNQKLNKARTFNKNKKGLSSSDWRSKSLGKQRSKNSVIKTSKNLTNKLNREKAKLEKPQVRRSITFKNGTEKQAIADISNDKAIRLNKQKVQAFKRNLFTIDNEINIDFQTKVLLAGQNGVGKTVFLKQIKHRELVGYYSPKLKIGYFDQNICVKQTDQTLIASLNETSMFDDSSTMQILGDLHLKQFAQQKISSLSGGQLVCFNLAKIITGQYNLLLLDEPTNFLDIGSINALAEFITNYPFAIILVSHDQAFVNQIKLKEWQIKSKKLLVSEPPVNENEKSNANELELLKFKLDSLMLSPNATIAEIKELKAKIEDLQ